MELMIDTNVILDIILKRNKYTEAVQFFKKLEDLCANAYISASQATDLFYILQKNLHNKELTYQAMEHIFVLVSVLSVSDTDIKEAFDKRWKDFEDCVQYVTARNNHMKYIVTSNTKDFEESQLEVLTVSDFLERY